MSAPLHVRLDLMDEASSLAKCIAALAAINVVPDRLTLDRRPGEMVSLTLRFDSPTSVEKLRRVIAKLATLPSLTSIDVPEVLIQTPCALGDCRPV